VTYTFKKPKRPVKRVFIHCSASDNPDHDNWSTIDQWHRKKGWAGGGYHFFIRKDGTLELGRDLEITPAAQEGNNKRTIAICLSGLAADRFTTAQLETLKGLCHQINRAYQDRVTFHGHCEVSAKSCPVFDYVSVLEIGEDGILPTVAFSAFAKDLHVRDLDGTELDVQERIGITLRQGSKGFAVQQLQKALGELGYFAGKVDGDFGPRTRAAVMAFQADNHLISDGIFGPVSEEALQDAAPRPVAPARTMASLTDLAQGGSRIAKASIANTIVGGFLGGGGAIAVVDQLTGVVSEITGQANAIQALFETHGVLSGAVILLAGAFVAFQSWRAGQARVEDHRTGKTS
jgi:hypothetical protein